MAILDGRLAGEDTKKLVGKADIGTPSAFYVKREVRAVKELALQFVQKAGDPAFANMVIWAMDAERRTVKKRRQSMATRRAG